MNEKRREKKKEDLEDIYLNRLAVRVAGCELSLAMRRKDEWFPGNPGATLSKVPAETRTGLLDPVLM